MSDLRKAAQQALEAMGCAVPTGKITLYEWDRAISDLSAALAQQPEPVCKCDLRTRLVGDGCEVCNPELAAEFAQQPEQEKSSYERGFIDGMQKQAESSVDRAVTQMALRVQERATPVKPAPPGLVGVVPITTVSVATQHRVLTDADLDAIRKIVREGGKE